MQFIISTLDSLIKYLSENNFKSSSQVLFGKKLELVSRKDFYSYIDMGSYEKVILRKVNFPYLWAMKILVMKTINMLSKFEKRFNKNWQKISQSVDLVKLKLSK